MSDKAQKDPIKGEDTSMKNVRVLMPFRLKGRGTKTGEVIAKKDFPSPQDYRNLLNMPKPRLEETNDSTGQPKASKSGDAKVPGGS